MVSGLSYTVGSIDAFLKPISGDHEYDNLFYQLKRANDIGIWMPGIGIARLVEEQDVDRESFYIFSITGAGGERFFKKEGFNSSFGNTCYRGGLLEVKQVPVQRIDWEYI